MRHRPALIGAGLTAALAAAVLVAPASPAEPPGTCAAVPSPPAESAGGAGSLELTSKQFAINQRIAQAAVRRAAAIEDWLSGGIVDSDICGGSLTRADFGPGVEIGVTSSPLAAIAARPRPLVVAAAGADPGVTFEVSAGQLLIAQRISQAAVRRAAALERRFAGGLTGVEVRNGTIGQARLVAGLRLVAADPKTPAVIVRTGPPAIGNDEAGGKVELSVRQMRINQKISQAAIRRLNVLRHRIERGLTGEQFRDGTLTGADIATGPASATPTTPPVTPGPVTPPVTPPVPPDAQFQNHWQFVTAPGQVPLSQIGPWQGVEIQGGLPNERLQALTSPIQGIAPYSVRFAVKDNDAAGGGGNRAELRIGTKTTGPDFGGDDVFSSFAVWFPPELTVGNWLIFHQMHPPSGPPNVSLELDGNASGTGPVELISWRRGGNKSAPNQAKFVIQDDVTRGAWHNFIYRVKWENDATGIYQLWHRIPSQATAWRMVANEQGVPTGFLHDYGSGLEFGRPYPKIGSYGSPNSGIAERATIHGGAHLRASSFGSAAALFGG